MGVAHRREDDRWKGWTVEWRRSAAAMLSGEGRAGVPAADQLYTTAATEEMSSGDAGRGRCL
jgi:hypothetical protein